jgi:hypothetical protein
MKKKAGFASDLRLLALVVLVAAVIVGVGLWGGTLF